MQLNELLPGRQDRMLLLGMTGSGKSTLMRALISLLPRDELIIVFDSKPDWRARHWWDWRRDMRDAPVILPHTRIALLRPGLYVFRPNYPEWRDPRVTAVLLGALRRKNCTLVIDETSDFAQNTYPMPALAKVIKQGRSKGVRMLMGSQRALAIPRIAITESNSFAVFRLRGEKDRERVGREIDDAMYEPPTGRYSFWYRNDSAPDSQAILVQGGVPRGIVKQLATAERPTGRAERSGRGGRGERDTRPHVA